MNDIKEEFLSLINCLSESLPNTGQSDNTFYNSLRDKLLKVNNLVQNVANNDSLNDNQYSKLENDTRKLEEHVRELTKDNLELTIAFEKAKKETFLLKCNSIKSEN